MCIHEEYMVIMFLNNICTTDNQFTETSIFMKAIYILFQLPMLLRCFYSTVLLIFLQHHLKMISNHIDREAAQENLEFGMCTV